MLIIGRSQSVHSRPRRGLIPVVEVIQVVRQYRRLEEHA